MIDTNELRRAAHAKTDCDFGSHEYCQIVANTDLHEQAADEIDELRAKVEELEAVLKEYEGATVVIVDDVDGDPCPLRRDEVDECGILGIYCCQDDINPDCPLRSSAVVVKMKNDQQK